jgi:MFS family permease
VVLHHLDSSAAGIETFTGMQGEMGVPVSTMGPSLNAKRGPSCTSLRGLDWFAFFVADIQTSFGPFLAVYLTTQKWTLADIGLVLTIGSLISLVGQMPGGAVVDAARSVRRAAAAAVIGIGASALVLALLPIFIIVVAARVLHAGSSCVLGPAIAAISLGLVGRAAIGERLGRNARFASIGNGLSAAVMGGLGYLLSSVAVFLVSAALAIPALIALFRIRAGEIDPAAAHGGSPEPKGARLSEGLRLLSHNRPLLVLSGCAALFHLANSTMLPLMASTVTKQMPARATIVIAACIVVPQLVVALCSPGVGRKAQTLGRKKILLIGFIALPVRGLLLAFVSNPYLLIAVQVLDGVSAAVLGVLVPLISADVTRGTGHFNLAQGMIGTAVGVGASVSGVLTGYAADLFGTTVTFLMLAGAGAVGLISVWALMPETRGSVTQPAACRTAGR